MRPDLALIHVGWGAIGAYETENVPRAAQHGIFSWLLVRQEDRWTIPAAQNTQIK